MGHVPGAGQITARQAAIAAGIPLEVPAITINKVRLGLVGRRDGRSDDPGRRDRCRGGRWHGIDDQRPFVLLKAREGARLGDSPMLDAMIHDGLWCAFDDRHMGEGTDAINAELGITWRTRMWAARSARAGARRVGVGSARDGGRVRRRASAPGGRSSWRATRASGRGHGGGARGLRPAFSSDGTVTAGNASQISDGGAALVVMSEERADHLGLEPLAEVVAFGMSADRYASLQTVPALALERALKKAGVAASDLGLIEVNEAFAAVSLHATRMLGLDEEIVNGTGAPSRSVIPSAQAVRGWC